MKFLVMFYFFAVTLTGFSAIAVTDKVVISGMDRPWAVVSGPDGNIWITEKRSGHILIYSPKFVLQKTLKGLPNLSSYVEGGLLDLAFHPKFKENNWLYVAYTVHGKAGYFVQINRFTYKNGALKEQKTLINGPASDVGNHFGSRLLFDDTGMLLASFGERLEKEKAQDMTVLNGKIVRLTEDGSIPNDNPFKNSPIFSFGHRNPQGLAIHPISRKIYDTEHGPSEFDAPGGGDELNELKAGGNFGWPLIHHRMESQGLIAPLLEYTPAIAPSGMIFYTGNAIPDWKNDLFFAALRGQQVVRARIDKKGNVTETEVLLKEKYGRLRDVETSPDGSLLVLAEDGRLIQLTN